MRWGSSLPLRTLLTLSVKGASWTSVAVSRTLWAPAETTTTPRGARTTVPSSWSTFALLENLKRVYLAHVWPLKGLEAIPRLSTTVSGLATTLEVRAPT